MFNDLCADLQQWWAGMPPEFAFLQILPFAIAAIAFLGDFVRRLLRR